jgi:hypothetical protein
MDFVDLTGDSQNSDGDGAVRAALPAFVAFCRRARKCLGTTPPLTPHRSPRRAAAAQGAAGGAYAADLLERVLERHPNAAPAQRALAATLSPDALLLILSGQADLEALNAQAARDAAGCYAAQDAQVASDATMAAQLEAELDAEDARVAAEHAALEKEEMNLLKARMAALAFREEGHDVPWLREGAGAEPFTQLVRSPTSDTPVPSATWRWRRVRGRPAVWPRRRRGRAACPRARARHVAGLRGPCSRRCRALRSASSLSAAAVQQRARNRTEVGVKQRA